MSYQLWLAAVARGTGREVIEVDGWGTRGEYMFDPKGVMFHHTGSPSLSDTAALNTVIYGRSDLIGPLSNYYVSRSGVIYVVAAGEANHAGEGSWPGIGSGNDSFIGNEVEHRGLASDPWPAEQLKSVELLHAAVLKHLGYKAATTNVSSGILLGHKEWAPLRKIDPISINMSVHRATVTDLIQNGESTVGEDMLGLELGEPGEPAKNYSEWGVTLQRMLNHRGANLQPDGKVGDKTRNAFRTWQTQVGIEDPATPLDFYRVGPRSYSRLHDA